MITTLEPRVKSGDLFDGLNPEDELTQRKLEVNKTSIEQMLKGFEKSPVAYPYFRLRDYIHVKTYEACVKNIPENYSKQDVETFAKFLNNAILPDFVDRRKIGFYLSALCNNCLEDDIVLEFSHLSDISYLGFKNRKNLIITGRLLDFGGFMESGNVEITGAVDGVGSNLSRGRINVQGDCKNVGTEMKGGEIIIVGNARGVGGKMKTGNIKVYGNVDGYLGYSMKGGEININGDYTGNKKVGRKFSGGTINIQGNREFQLSIDMKGGDIHQQGKPIVLNGRRVLE